MENALSRLALDLAHDGISLHRLESGAWIMLDHIPLQVGTLKANMARLRDLAERSGGKVLVWMPPEQIHVHRVRTGGLGKPEQILAARTAFAESGLSATDALEFHIGPMADDGTAPVAAIDASVLEEAREFIAQHGFEATGFSTRSPIGAFEGKPHFAASEPRGRLAGQALAAVAGIALAVGVGSLVWTGIGLFTRSSEPAFEVSSLLPPPGQEGAPLSPASTPGIAPPDLSDATTPVAPPETGTSFAAYYAFPDDQNAVQIAVPGNFSTDAPPEIDQLPGPDTSVNPPRIAAALDPGQEGDTIPNIFTGNVQEEVTAPQPPRPTLLGLTAPALSAPAGRARALSGLDIRQPATSMADFLIPVALPFIPQPEVTDTVIRPAENFPVYLPVSPMADTPGQATGIAGFGPGADKADPQPRITGAAGPPAGQDLVAEAVSNLAEDALPSRFASVETLPLVPLLPGQAQPADGPTPLPAWSDSLPPPAPAEPAASEDGSPDAETPAPAIAEPEAVPETSPAEPGSDAPIAEAPEPDATAPADVAVAEPETPSPEPASEAETALAEPEAPAPPDVAVAETDAPAAEPASEVETALAEALTETAEDPAADETTPETEDESQLAALDPEAARTVETPSPRPDDPRAPDAEILDPDAAEAATEDLPEDAEPPETAPDIPVIATVPPVEPHLRPRPDEPTGDEAEDVVAALIEQALSDPPAAPVTDGIRPRARPDDLVREVPEVATPDAPERSRYALLYSERPRNRPKSFASQVVRVATSPPSDPVPTTPQVQLPSSASVQQAATTRDAINLRNINLLGVAGSDGRRTAIIRMPNGQIVSVKTGDKFSGYQVAAIGRNAIRIRKNGRDTVLEIPD